MRKPAHTPPGTVAPPHRWVALRPDCSPAAWSASATLLLTSVHHAYGAYVYASPWRLHVVLVSVVTLAVMAAALAVQRGRASGPMAQSLAFWLFALVTLAVPVVLVGGSKGCTTMWPRTCSTSAGRRRPPGAGCFHRRVMSRRPMSSLK